jgi:molybdate transport system substrate-binding protein
MALSSAPLRLCVIMARSSAPLRLCVMILMLPCALMSVAAGRASSQPSARPATVHVAVASNFAEAHDYIAAAFEAATGHSVLTSLGSTGQLYAQIRNGAPFDVFLAADEARPARLVADGEAIADSRFTYALGRLVLYGPSLDSVRAHGVDLRDERNRRVAIANPKLAPYGRAAAQTIERLGLTERLASRLVQGENIAQTFQFVHTGAAELGFVALSQVYRETRDGYWLVPQEYHDRIAQDAVLLRRGGENAAAVALMDFLRGDTARRIIEGFGYGESR